jgi:dUTP pyrophosphatase
LFILLVLLATSTKLDAADWIIVCIDSIIMLTFICVLETFKPVHILFCKTHPEAVIPSRKRGNAGFDIYGLLPEGNTDNYVIVNPHETIMLPTGIKSVIPDDYYIQIQERGSSGSKGIKYSAGVVDSNYRGEWFLGVTNANDKPVVFYKESKWYSDTLDTLAKAEKECGRGDYIPYPLSKAIFQGVLHKTHDDITAKEVDEEKFNKYKTDRGEGKLGSSGK